jgi:hypothetical protein
MGRVNTAVPMDEAVTTMRPLRFVVLLHRPGPGCDRTTSEHLDWMFEVDGQLRTWSTPILDLVNAGGSLESACQLLPDHRLVYLEYEGHVSQSRGEVRQVLLGHYRLICDLPDRFEAALEWIGDKGPMLASVAIYRSLSSADETPREDSLASWWLRFSAGR